jgi:hypothetical protein
VSVGCVNVGVLGDASMTCEQPAEADGIAAEPGTTTGEDGTGSGNQLTVPLTGTLDVGCMGVAVLGQSALECSGGQQPPAADQPGDPGDPTQPGQPGDPTQPGQPADPADPEQPGNPGGEPGALPGGDGTAVAGSRIPAVSANEATGATGATGVLAMTGGQGLPFAAVGLLLLLLGGGMARAGRRRGLTQG